MRNILTRPFRLVAPVILAIVLAAGVAPAPSYGRVAASSSTETAGNVLPSAIDSPFEPLCAPQYSISLGSVSGGAGSQPPLFYTDPILVSGAISATNFAGQPEQYHVQINWGDGSVDPNAPFQKHSADQDKSFSGNWTAASGHTYAASKSYTIAATLYHQCFPGAEKSTVAQATVNILVLRLPYVYGYVFDDADGNGTRGGGEVGIAGATVALSGPTPRTATTLANGFYRFADLVPGSYTVNETNPPGYLSTTPDMVSLVVAPESTSRVDFGDMKAQPPSGKAVIYGTVYNDQDEDGVRDPGEMGIAGATVILTGPSWKTLSTDANGVFGSEVTVAGSYVLIETDQAGYVSVTPNAIQIDVELGRSYQINFGDKQLPPPQPGKAVVYGTVFSDTNGNGSMENFETGLAGATVTLNGPTPRTATTLTSGLYRFADLTPGAYTVSETNPAGYITTSPDRVELVAAADMSYRVDFGDMKGPPPPPGKASIYGTVFNDLDADRVRDTGESGIAGVVLRLSGASSNTTTSNANGAYAFPVGIAGSYTVTEDIVPNHLSTTPNPVTLAVELDQSYEVDFGNKKLQPPDPGKAIIYGLVFDDADRDGFKADNETGIAGAIVTLTGPTPGTATTLANGLYQFESLTPGTYSVNETNPSGYASTTSDVVSVVAAPDSRHRVNFGDTKGQPPQPDEAIIKGTVFNDLNANGRRDGGEPGIAGVTITLTGPSSNTTGTNADGGFTFTMTTAGTYTVTETDPDGCASTTPNVVQVEAVLGQTHVVDFGDKQAPPPEPGKSVIYGYVFEDANDDGARQDDELGLSGATVTLSGPTPASVVTLDDGYFEFKGLTPGNYTVNETNPSGHASTSPDRIELVAAPDMSYLVDFGDRPWPPRPGDLPVFYGTVFNDADADGEWDAGEVGIEGVHVQVSRGSAGSLRPTDAYGSYTLKGNSTGVYRVDESNLPGWLSSTPDVVEVNVTEPGLSHRVDFGDFLLPPDPGKGAIYGMVFEDKDADKKMGGCETILAGATITLTGPGGQTTVTPSNGFYLFTRLQPDTYILSETNPPGYPVSTTPDNVKLILAANMTERLDFGDRIIVPEDSAQITGTVFNDLNEDQVKNDGEDGLAGVTITFNGPTSATATTNATGGYSFTVTQPGWYYIKEKDPAGYRSISPNNFSLDIYLRETHILDFADKEITPEPGKSVIYGYVFDDSDNDGLKSDIEPGLSGVTVTRSGIPQVLVTTDAEGYYEFVGLTPGLYTITETNPPRYPFSITSDRVELEAIADTSHRVDFADQIYPLPPVDKAVVWGTVFDDADGDMVRDANETGIEGVCVMLSGEIYSSRTYSSSSGIYYFGVKDPGVYRVVDAGQPDCIPTTPCTADLDVAIGGIYRTDFGLMRLVPPEPGKSIIYGYVFEDANSNGLKSDDESGIAGASVTLTGPTQGTMVTGATGFFEFTGLIPGSYTVNETNPSGYTSVTPDRVELVTAANMTYRVDFADRANTPPPADKAIIYGTVFNDLDEDEARDAGEPGIAGVTIALSGSSSNTTITNSNGSYTFAVVPGTYNVTQIDLPGYLSTTPNTVNGIDAKSGNSYEVDFGDKAAPPPQPDKAVIYGMVFDDADQDGSKDTGEAGIEGAIVVITGPTPGSVATLSNGLFSFGNLLPGSYTINETNPSVYPVSTTPNRVELVAAANMTYPVDFGDAQVPPLPDSASIYGTVYSDLNTNGVRDPGESGIPGLVVNLTGASSRTATTNANGGYTMTVTQPGLYTLTVVGGPNYYSTTDDTVEFPVLLGGRYERDLGGLLIIPNGDSIVYGMVFDDSNGNGVRNSGEGGIGNVTVNLLGFTFFSSSTRNAMAASDTEIVSVQSLATYVAKTSPIGLYVFFDLAPGLYLVNEVNPTHTSTTTDYVFLLVESGRVYQVSFGDALPDPSDAFIYGTVFNDVNADGIQDAGETGIQGVTVSIDGQSSLVTDEYGRYTFRVAPSVPHSVTETDPTGYVSTTSNVVNLSVPPGESRQVDFGDAPFNPPVDRSTIYGVVFSDNNSNGVQDAGEVGIAGVGVDLGGAAAATANTTAGGLFFFRDLAPGLYSVTERNLSGFQSTTPDLVFIVASSGVAHRVDFGDTTPDPDNFAVIYGAVFDDVNADGVQDMGENGIHSAGVSLDGSQSTITRSNGGYTLRVTSQGSHSVTQTDLPGYLSTTANTVTIEGVTFGNSYVADFGDLAPPPQSTSAIVGTVFNDANGNTKRDAGESGIEGVVITLNGATANTTTSRTGFYRFNNLIPGSYIVNEINPSGHFSTTLDTIRVEAAAGALSQVDFGDLPFIPNNIAVIYGSVFNDLNADGVQDPGEGGIEGTSISLSGSSADTTATDSNGSYAFVVTAPGSLTVTETDLPEYYSSTNNTVERSVSPGAAYRIDFADPPLTTCAISLTPSLVSNQLPGDMTETLTVTILDQHSAGLEGIHVVTTTTFGSLSIEGSTTDATGTVEFTASSSTVGRSTVTATAGPISDTAVIQWLAPYVPPGPNPPTPTPTPTPTPSPTPTSSPTTRGYGSRFFTVDFLGKITMGNMSDDGRLVDDIDAESPDGSSVLRLEKETRTTDSEGEVVSLIMVVEAEEVPGLPARTFIVGKAYEFTPAGASFSKPIRLTLGYDIEELPVVVDSIILGNYRPSTGWESLEGESGIVAGVGKLTAPVEHFSIMAVLARTTSASFKVSNLVVTPSEKKYWRRFPIITKAGQQVSISADITNTGGERGVLKLALTFDGKETDEQFVALGPLETKTVDFTLSGLPKGQHNLQIGDLTSEFKTLQIFRWWLLLIVLVVVAALLWLGYRFAFK